MVSFVEMRALLEVCKKEEDRLILKLFYSTGMRTGELSELKLRDLFYDKTKDIHH